MGRTKILSEMKPIIQSLLLSFVFSTISASTISPGSTLYASSTNQTWSSPNNTFSLGFVPVHPPTSPPSFIAAIFYSVGVPIVWSAANGVSVDSGGSFQFLSTGSLRLVNSYGATVWDSGTSNMSVSSASLGDDGNLVLSNGTGSSICSSFDHPTDTILPSQNFATSMVLRSGLYSCRLLPSGNLILRWNESTLYWNQALNSSINGRLTSPVLGLQPIGILSIYDPKLKTPEVVAYSSDYAEGSDVLRILKLDNDGNLRIYSSVRGSGTATVRWAAVDDQCEVFAYCGNYGVCRYKDSNSNPNCGCPSQNFELVDPKDSRKGCRRKMQLEDCPGNETMLELKHTQLLTYPPANSAETFFIGISACRGNCLAADSCYASTSLSDGSGLCYLKIQDFVSGNQSPAIPSISYVKVCGPVSPNSPPSSA